MQSVKSFGSLASGMTDGSSPTSSRYGTTNKAKMAAAAKKKNSLPIPITAMMTDAMNIAGPERKLSGVVVKTAEANPKSGGGFGIKGRRRRKTDGQLEFRFEANPRGSLGMLHGSHSQGDDLGDLRSLPQQMHDLEDFDRGHPVGVLNRGHSDGGSTNSRHSRTSLV